MANKRLSKLKSSELEASELGLADEVHEFSLSGVLSLTAEENTNNVYANGREKSNSVGTASDKSHDTEDENYDEEGIDESYEKIHSISLLTTSISRGLSISVMRQKKVMLNFDIIESRITGRRKHVLYTLAVTTTPGLDSDKAVIERRYSDFHKLYKELKKSFPDFMETIEFPPKKVYGNLKDSLRNDRSRLLQNFIRYIYENEEIRNSNTFKKFFYTESLQQGCRYICGGMFEQALNYLLNGLHLQQKLALDSTNEIIATLCSIVECYMTLKSYDEVVKYADAAKELIEDDMSNVYFVPLLKTLINAYAALEKNTDEFERKLKEVVNINQIEVEHLPTLRELAVKRFAKK